MLKRLLKSETKMQYLDAETRFAKNKFEAAWRKALLADGSLTPHSQKMAGLQLATAESFILQSVGPGQSRVRLCGSRYSHLLEDAKSGFCLSTLFTEKSAETIRELTDAAFTLPALLSIPVISQASPILRAVPGELVILPLVNSNGCVDHAIGALFCNTSRKINALNFSVAKNRSFHFEEIVVKKPENSRPARGKPRLVVTNT